MKNKVLFGIECVSIIPIGKFCLEKSEVVEISEINYLYSSVNNNVVKTTTEHEYAIELLKAGKGIFYKGEIIFAYNNYKESKYYKKYLRENRKIKKSCNPNIIKNMKDTYYYPLITSVLGLYEKGLIDEDIAKTKLEAYLSIDIIPTLLEKESA